MTLEHHERRLDALDLRVDRLATRLGALEDRQAAPPAPAADETDVFDLGIELNLAGMQRRLKMLLEDSEGLWAQDPGAGTGALVAHIECLEEGIASILRDSGEPV